MAEMCEWTKAILCRITDDFEAADKDKNGYLSFTEVCGVLERSGFHGTTYEAKASILLLLLLLKRQKRALYMKIQINK